MAGYINYQDIEGLEHVEEKLQSGDIKGYRDQLKSVLNSVSQNDGGRIKAEMFQNIIKEKLRSIDTRYQLSKSTFVRGKQCHKSLYLNKHKKGERDQLSPKKRALFKGGRDFEENFRKSLGEGINLNTYEDLKVWNYPFYTQYLLDSDQKLIFEAGFTKNQILVLVDVLKVNEDNSYTVYEVKNTSKIKEVHLWDMTIQYYVVKEKLGSIKEFNLVLNDKGTFRIKNCLEELEKRIDQIETEIDEFKAILKKDTEPVIAIGQHCDYPYGCDFKGYCSVNDAESKNNIGLKT